MFLVKIVISVVILIIVIGLILTIVNKVRDGDFDNLPKPKRKTVLSVVGILFLLCCVFNTVYFTNEQEIGFTSMFGHNSMIEGPGMHFKVPFLSHKHIYDATTQGMPIGYNEGTDEILEEDSLMITSDFNFVNIDFYVEYRITDPIEYRYGTDNPRVVFKNIAQSAIRNTVGQYDVDAVMTTGKTEIEMQVFADIVKELENHHTGLTVGNVTIQDAESPTAEVAKAFTDVVNAKSKAQTVINEAHSYENTQIPEAEAKAVEIKQAATAAKTERVNAAKEEVARFEALFAEYQDNPNAVRKRLYYEAIQEILPNMEIIVGEDTNVIYITEGTGNSNVGTAAAISQASSNATQSNNQ